jgi:hypothetical protein
MTGRRRHPRYLLTKPFDGDLRLREEVSVEHWGEQIVVVISSAPCRRSERLTLEVPGDGRRRVNVVVTESRPIVAPDGAIRHRVSLAVTPVNDTIPAKRPAP